MSRRRYGGSVCSSIDDHASRQTGSFVPPLRSYTETREEETGDPKKPSLVVSSRRSRLKHGATRHIMPTASSWSRAT